MVTGKEQRHVTVVQSENNRSEFTVRPAMAEDAEEIARLATELGYPSSAQEVEARLKSLVKDPEHAAFVAAKAGRVIGWVHVFVKHLLESDEEAEIGGLVVDARHQGSGAGHLLMQHAEQWARAKGLRSVYLRSNVIRKDAHAFYQKSGYQVVKTQFALRKIL
ncbi:MAG: GNAT family N-acetyltransferase [Acidobacteriia bacterium]|nr:GNAT family N-acetyltransferase [Terriglobia bacterium]